MITLRRFCLLIAVLAIAIPAIARPVETQRWAVIAVDETSRSTADLLIVELSQSEGIELLERDRIRAALDEQRLSAAGLVSSESMIRLGEILSADALMMIDTSDAEADSQNTRVRVVDTRTSIRIAQQLVSTKSAADNPAELVSALLTARETLDRPIEELKLISLSRVVSGEPGQYLRAACRTLHVLLGGELQRLPEWIVLEREDLQRLTRERDLTGIELQLRGAARVAEISVRRSPDGDGLIASCRLTPLGGQAVEFEVPSDSGDLGRLRDLIVSQITGHSAAAGTKPASSPQQEALVFEKRSRQFHGAYRPVEAAEFMEAAYALEPTRERLRYLQMDYHSALHLKQVETSLEKLLVVRRLAELKLESERRFPSRFGSVILRMTSGEVVPSRSGGDSDDAGLTVKTPEEREIYEEIVELRRQKIRLQLDRAKDDPLRTFILRLRMIDIELWSSRSQQPHRADLVRRMLLDVSNQLDAWWIKRDYADQRYRDYLCRVVLLISRVDQNRRDVRWHVGSPTAWANGLEVLDPEIAGLVKHLFQLGERGAAGTQAARDLLTAIDELPKGADEISGLDSTFRRRAAAKLPPDEGIGYLEKQVARAEREGNVEHLLRLSSTFSWMMRPNHWQTMLPLAQRIDALMPKPIPPRDHRRYSPLSVPVHALLFRARVAKGNLVTKPTAFSLEGADEGWQGFRAHPIRFDVSRSYNVFDVFVDHRDDAPARGGRLIVVRGLPWGMIAVDRVPISGGKPKQIGPTFKGGPVAFRGIQVAVSDDAIYIASKAPGFFRLTENKAEQFSESEGAASNDVWKMTWFGDHLYVAWADAFGRFDPRGKRFEVFASSTSATKRNPLDGKGSFFIRKLEKDRKNGCLWMSIQDNAIPRTSNGLWKFTPPGDDGSTGSYEKISGGHVAFTKGSQSLLLHRSADPPIALCDRATGEVRGLEGFSHASAGTSYPTPLLLKFGDDLIGNNGALYSADGIKHEIPGTHRWKLLQRLGNGFVTHYDKEANAVWLIEPTP